MLDNIRSLCTALLVAACSSAICLSAEPPQFDLRILHDIAPERTGNWAIKITDLPDGRLLMVWCSTAGAEVSRTNCLWVSYSHDDGENWSQPEKFAASNAEESVLNPCCYTHANGRVFIFYNDIQGNTHDRSFRVACQTLEKGAREWGPRWLLPVGDANTGLMSNPIRLRDGTIVLPIYFEHGKDNWVGSVMRSTDDGQTWSRGGEMTIDAPRGAAEPTIAELRDGKLYCLIRNKTGWLYQSWSEDGGQTWTKPTKSRFQSPEATPILWRLKGGSLLLVWNNNTVSGGSQQPRYPLCAALSNDDAKTWPYQRMIATTSGERQLSNHGVFQTRKGTILVAMNHFLGIRNSVEFGPILLARFNEVWLRRQPSPASPAPISPGW